MYCIVIACAYSIFYYVLGDCIGLVASLRITFPIFRTLSEICHDVMCIKVFSETTINTYLPYFKVLNQIWCANGQNGAESHGKCKVGCLICPELNQILLYCLLQYKYLQQYSSCCVFIQNIRMIKWWRNLWLSLIKWGFSKNNEKW